MKTTKSRLELTSRFKVFYGPSHIWKKDVRTLVIVLIVRVVATERVRTMYKSVQLYHLSMLIARKYALFDEVRTLVFKISYVHLDDRKKSVIGLCYVQLYVHL